MKTLKLIVMLAALMLFAASAVAQTASVGYTEEYRWHGFSVYGDRYVHPGFTTTVRGVDVGVVAHTDDAEMDDLKHWDTKVGYNLTDVAGLNLRAEYNYLVLPAMDAQEISLTAQLPGTISPRYTLTHVVPDNADNGQIHVFGVDVALGDLCDPKAVTAMLSADVTYNDGVNPFGQAVIRDFTHITAGFVVNVPVGDISIQPAVYYQHTFEDAIADDKNEVWYGLSVQYGF